MNYDEVDKKTAGVLFSKGTQILEQFNKFVTRLLESGVIIKHQKDTRNPFFYSDDEEDTSEQHFVFTISHILVAFYVLAIGHSLAIVIFLLELLHHSYSTNRQRIARRTITERLS
jgi:hypothetical protein